MPVYKGTTKLTGFQLGSNTVKKVFKGEDIIFAQMNLNFDEQGGSSVTNKVVVYGEQYGTLQLSSKSYYTFGGWSKIIGGTSVYSSTIVDEIDDFTLYAKWNKAPGSPTVSLNEAFTNSLYFEITNPNPYEVAVYYEENTSPPTSNLKVISANSTSYALLSGLSPNTSYTVYFRCYSDGEYSSPVSLTVSTLAAVPAWTYLGTSTRPDDINASAIGTGKCPSSTAAKTALTNSHPPQNYSLGTVAKVNCYANGNFPPPPVCATFYFERT